MSHSFYGEFPLQFPSFVQAISKAILAQKIFCLNIELLKFKQDEHIIKKYSEIAQFSGL